jgi:hypothetical protein
MSRYRIVMIDLLVQEASDAAMVSPTPVEMIHYAEWQLNPQGSVFETSNLDEARDRRDEALGRHGDKFDYQIVELVQ